MNYLYFLLLILPVQLFAGEFGTDLTFEARGFYEKGPQHPDQQRSEGSLVFEPKYEHAWNNERDVLGVELFARVNSIDKNRTHADIGRLDWVKSLDEWEIRVGIRKVFWGVTESAHLVDIINQTDLVENFDGEKKLGQPMVNLAWVKDFGTFDFYVLPYFRKRTFPGKKGRFRFAVPVSDKESYESSANEHHIDLAFRWSHSFDIFDVGISHFDGTSREPRFLFSTDAGAPVLRPHYDLIQQTGIDLQMTKGPWLLKLEAIARNWNSDQHVASVTGFEYTMANFSGNGADLGLIAEYLQDDRQKKATTPFENDLFAGARYALNDEDDLQFLTGIIADLDNSTHFFNLEASRLIGNTMKLTVESRSFLNVADSDSLAKAFEHESYSQVELMYSF